MTNPKKNLKSFIWIVLLSVFCSGTISASEYDVNRDLKNSAKFISISKFESFDGITDKIDGYVLWDGQDLKVDSLPSKSELYFEVQLDGLDTGIGLRNRHMRENYLETDKYPLAKYSGQITKVENSPDRGLIITAEGKFSVHGVERPMTISGVITPGENAYHVKSDFEIKLPDFNIKIPSLMFLKINEIIKVALDFNLKRVPDKGGK